MTNEEPLEQDPFTPAERRAWAALTLVAPMILDLPVEHPSERLDAAAAIHVLQRQILARPTRRLLREIGDETIRILELDEQIERPLEGR